VCDDAYFIEYIYTSSVGYKHLDTHRDERANELANPDDLCFTKRVPYSHVDPGSFTNRYVDA
jgi:hypothetical protein